MIHPMIKAPSSISDPSSYLAKRELRDQVKEPDQQSPSCDQAAVVPFP